MVESELLELSPVEICVPIMAVNGQNENLIQQVVNLIEERTGLAANAYNPNDLREVLQNISSGDPETLVRRLQNTPETYPEWQRLIHTLTIGETYFLRDKTHFDLLKEQILPEIVLKRRKQEQRFIYIWSVGCATGEEPYSLATVLYEFLPDLADWHIRIIGTDVNLRALQIANRAVYRKWSFRHTNDNFRIRYFDTHPDGWKLKSFITDMVDFQHLNILSKPPIPQFDIIFSRNILLYFHRESQKRAEDILYQALSPGGYLVLGQAEAVHSERNRWITHVFPGTSIYQKPGEGVAFGAGDISYPKKPPSLVDTPRSLPSRPRLPEYELAVKAIHQDQLEEAERHLSEVLARYPDHAHAHMLLAFVHANRKAIPEAQAHLATALLQQPLLADAHYIRAMIYMEENKLERARQSLQAALYCNRDHALAAFMFGNLLAQDGDLSKAYRAWEKARRAIAKRHPDSYFSDISDMTVKGFDSLIASHLDGT